MKDPRNFYVVVQVGTEGLAVAQSAHPAYDAAKSLIGCDMVESVRTEFMMKVLGPGFRMLVDEDGNRNNLRINLVASYLYDNKAIDKKQSFQSIVGKAVIVREYMTPDGMDLIGLTKEESAVILIKLNILIESLIERFAN